MKGIPMAKTLSDDRARQGPRGRTVLYVLVGGLILAAVYLGSMLMWSGSQTPTSPSQGASQNQNSGGAASRNSANVPAANPVYPSPSTPPNGPKQ